MSWALSLLIALLSGLVSAICAGWVAWQGMAWHRVGDFEGQRGFALVGSVLLGLLAGIIIGLVAARTYGQRPDVHWRSALWRAMTVDGGLLLLVLAMSYATAAHPPTRHGTGLILDVEVLVAQRILLDPFQDDSTEFHITLYGHDPRENVTVRVRLADAFLENGYWRFPASLPILTSDPDRRLGFSMTSFGTTFLELPLVARPDTGSTWSDWIPRTREAALQADTTVQFTYRFRVRTDGP
ncbi:MAG: hypothetical protein H6595_11805 [Flavobacteriales bacterium]|nr:hypothetical protein [Flavobacteriales bacterium]MCB9168145.1 hypothetical protein [Flavobacteriales bacterium]MCB9194290.1 hypothetical protein [Flavobacteriales bacterium]